MKVYLFRRNNVERMNILAVLLLFPLEAKTKVFWTLETNPITIGKYVELFCNTSASSIQNVAEWAWFGNKKKYVLTFRNLTSDSKKYSTKVVDGGFNLVIKHFSEHDIMSYTCHYGSDEYMSNLEVGENFEKLPTNGSIIKRKQLTDGRRFDFTIKFLEVHPIPHCSLYQKLKTIDVSRSLNITNITKKGLYYDVLIAFAYEGDCYTETVNVDCLIGTSTVKILEAEISFQCKDKETTEITVPTICAVASFLITICICFLCFKRKSSRDQIVWLNHENDDIDEPIYMPWLPEDTDDTNE